MCKFCGYDKQLDWHHDIQDFQCPICKAFQHLEYTKVNYLTHRWYDIIPVKDDKRTLVRVSWMGQLKRDGQVVTVIDYPARGIS